MIDVQSSDAGNGDTSDDLNDYLSLISAKVDTISVRLRHLSLRIHDNPEIRNKEFIAHEAITTFMRSQEVPTWTVTPSAYDIATAFVAVFDSGKPGPVVSFNAEYGMYYNIQI